MFLNINAPSPTTTDINIFIKIVDEHFDVILDKIVCSIFLQNRVFQELSYKSFDIMVMFEFCGHNSLLDSFFI